MYMYVYKGYVICRLKKMASRLLDWHNEPKCKTKLEKGPCNSHNLIIEGQRAILYAPETM